MTLVLKSALSDVARERRAAIPRGTLAQLLREALIEARSVEVTDAFREGHWSALRADRWRVTERGRKALEEA